MNENAKDRPWSRPWTTSEIIENAENWSLAGDAALLNTLKSFGDKILTKTNETNCNLDSLTQNLEEHTLRLDLIRNKFDGLRNTQFIESRVYEEDETLHIDEQPQQKEEVPVKEEDKLNELKDVVEGALNILDKYYEEVEVDISDSEDDTEVGRYVYQLKDPYMNRRLPHIIGSEQWHQKWHVGLKDSSSEVESEQSSESYSESDSDEDFPTQGISKKNGTSSSNSELDLLSKADISQPAASSTFNASKTEFASSSDSGQGSLPVQVAATNVSFAEQLSAKLGTIKSEKEDSSNSDINTAPIQKSLDQNKYPGIFFDEPPPLEDTSQKIANRNLYTGVDLFGDDDNTSFWGEEKSAISKKSEDLNNKQSLISSNNDEILVNKNVVKSEKNKSKGFFDDSESDDDLFKVKKPEIDKPYLSSYLGQPKKAAVPLIDEPPELRKESDEVSKKKPIGGISVLGKSVALQIGNVLKNRPRISSESSEEEKDTVDEKSPPQRQSQIGHDKKNPKIIEPRKDEASLQKSYIFEDSVDAKNNRGTKNKEISLFDDDDNDDFFKDDLFSNISSGKTKAKLFDDDLLEDSLFGTKHNIERTKNDSNKILVDNKNDTRSVPTQKDTNKLAHFEEPKKVNLFKEEDQYDDIFTEKDSNLKLSPDDSKKISTKTESSKSNLNETNKNLQQIEDNNLFKKDENKKDKQSKLSLFDDSDDSNDELFNIDFKIKTNLTESTSKAKPAEDNKKVESIKTETREINFASSKESESISSCQLGDTSTTTPTSRLSHTIESQSQSSQIDETSTASSFQPIPDNKTERSHSISLFDPTPPPDDVNWGDDSQSNPGDDLFLEEDLSDGANPGHGIASLNETSGFGRDYLTLTDETERYSFYPSEPEASSSRRLSSDIFSEQQSEDMLFITKNRTDSTSLQPIPEIDNQTSNSATSDSIFNITPSGNMDDLFSGELSLSKPAANSDSLFDDNIQDDLFGSMISSQNHPIEENKSAELNQNVATVENNKSENNQQKEKIKPPSVPGKLRHNLNINVSALLPGSAPPKRIDVPVPGIDESAPSKRLDMPIPGIHDSVKSNDPIFMGKDAVDDASVKSISQSASEIFGNDNQDIVKILHSVTKDRPRIQVKRRPSTRKGRKELRSEHISDTVEAVDVVKTETFDKHPPQSVEEVKSESLLNPLVIKQSSFEAKIVKIKVEPDDVKSNGENIFSGVDESKSETVDNNSPDDTDIFSNYLKKEQSIVTGPKPIENSIPKSEFFNETILDTAMKVESEDDLFSVKNTKKFENKSLSFFDNPIDETSTKELPAADENILQKKIDKATDKSDKKDSFGIFDEEDDDDIFSNAKNSAKTVPKKTTLFGDESDEDNDGLFSTKATASAASIPKDTKHGKKNIKPTVRKLENTKVEYDPLSNLLEE